MFAFSRAVRAMAALFIIGCGAAAAGCGNKHEPNRNTARRPTANFMAADPVFISSQSQYLVSEHNVGRAWAYGTGRNITVAVIDGGQMQHEDMVGAYATGGYDFVNEDEDPFLTRQDVQDVFSNPFAFYPYDHGTATASLVAARGNNGLGMCGIAPNAKVLPIQVFTPDGWSSYDILADAINFARANRVRVISMSFGGYDYGSVLLEATYRAHKAGIILVAAAGNESLRLGAKDEDPNLFPAGYPWVISVGATQLDRFGNVSEVNRASFSNFGESVDIFCRGRDVTIAQGFAVRFGGEFDPFFGFSNVSLAFGSLYESGNGTSFACPQVAGLIAVALEIQPDLDTETIRTLLQESADELPVHGRKLLNMGRFLEAVANLAPAVPVVPPPPGIPQVPPHPSLAPALARALSSPDRGDRNILLSAQSRAERQQSLFDRNRRLRINWRDGRMSRDHER